MLGHRLRRSPNIQTTLAKHLVIAKIQLTISRWVGKTDHRPTLCDFIAAMK